MATILVTGATDGIGRETARILVSRGADVVVHGRTADKAEQARSEVKAKRAVAADLTSLEEVRALAKHVGDFGVIDVVINNAGVYMKKRAETTDGRELTMAVNHDAPFLLTHLLLPALMKSKDARVINVSSIAHGRGRVDVDDIDMKRAWDGYGAYASSKLANILFTMELAKRLRATSVKVNALHPGVVSTKLLQAGFGMNGPDSLSAGAATSVQLALDPLAVTGRYFAATRESAPSKTAHDEDLCRRFYEASCARVGVPPLPERV